MPIPGAAGNETPEVRRRSSARYPHRPNITRRITHPGDAAGTAPALPLVTVTRGGPDQGDAMNAERGTDHTDGALYRLEIGGSVAASWIDWFEADTITPLGENTVLEVRVSDQAELYGRLRRIHDLNLRLVSLTFVGPASTGA